RMVDAHAELVDRRRDVGVVDLRRSDLLAALPGLFEGPVAIVRLVDAHRGADAERIDAAARPSTRCAGARIDGAGLLRDANSHDLGDHCARELRAEPAALAGAVPRTEHERGG